jgi:hypothetical protein
MYSKVDKDATQTGYLKSKWRPRRHPTIGRICVENDANSWRMQLAQLAVQN